jgi:hypothetical protein
MTARSGEIIVPTTFEEPNIAEDLTYHADAAATALRKLRLEIDRDGGIPHSRLKRCEDEGRDGTRLEDCLKTYVPWPVGKWGIVFIPVVHPTRPWALHAIDFGVRHKPGRGRLTVYEVADRRLIEIIARDLRESDS